MTEALAHVDHCDVLVTACLHQTKHGRMATLAVQLDEGLAPIELVGIGEGLIVLAQQLIDQGTRAQARSN
jgi:hypothetical protein